MRIETNAANRKDVVKAVSGILGEPSKYLGVPTCAYQIGNCTIDKKGAVVTEDEKTAEMVTAGLTEQGFLGNQQPEADETTVSIPVEGMSAEGLKNLIFLTHSKQYLINRAFAEEVFRIPAELAEALGSAEIPDAETFLQTFQSHAEGCRGIGFQDGKITFTLPTADDPDMIKAFTHLTAAMVRQAKEQKRISPKETIEENEKYYMRIWLLRRGGERDTGPSDEKAERAFRFPHRGKQTEVAGSPPERAGGGKAAGTVTCGGNGGGAGDGHGRGSGGCGADRAGQPEF